MNRDSADGLPLRLLRVSLLFATCVGYSALRVPVPGVNEPHYLTKSRHYWQPEWCAGDLFLESANAHQVFYQTIGWLSAVCSLEQAAWIGRALALLLLAAGWNHFFGRLTKTRLGPLWTAWLFLLLHTIGNFSGEWLVGGVEAKVFSYGFVFWGYGCLLRGQAIRTAAAFGLAVSMHPVVGTWSVTSGIAATLITVRMCPDSDLESLVQSLRSQRGLVAAAVLVILSLPGLLPAFGLLLSSDPELAGRANFIQFTHRLSHHLDPQSFSDFSYWYYFAMISVWAGIVAWTVKTKPVEWTWPVKWFQWLVAVSVLVAVAGCLMAVGPRPMPTGDIRLALLKFYPFRLADILVPLLISVLTVRFAESLLLRSENSRRQLAAVWTCFGIAFVVSVTLPGRDRNPAGMDHETHREWLDVCEWIRRETPPDSVLFSVNENWAVKWYAERPEYVNFKDCPQDAAGIVEWYERERLRRAFTDGRASVHELEQLQYSTDISYLISRELPLTDSLPVYHNKIFHVYALGGEDVTIDDRED